MPRFVVFVTTLVLAFFVAGCSRELSPVSPVARGPDFQFDDGLLLTKLDGTEEPQGTDPAPIITIMNVTFPPGTESAPGREFEIELPANSLFRVPWTAVASPGSQIARTRWALGLLDAPPPTDGIASFSSTWAPWGNGEHSVTVGPFPEGGARALFIEVEDDLARRSLAIIRMRWIAFHSEQENPRWTRARRAR